MNEQQAEKLAAEIAEGLVYGRDYTAVWLVRAPSSGPDRTALWGVVVVPQDRGERDVWVFHQFDPKDWPRIVANANLTFGKGVQQVNDSESELKTLARESWLWKPDLHYPSPFDELLDAYLRAPRDWETQDRQAVACDNVSESARVGTHISDALLPNIEVWVKAAWAYLDRTYPDPVAVELDREFLSHAFRWYQRMLEFEPAADTQT